MTPEQCTEVEGVLYDVAMRVKREANDPASELRSLAEAVHALARLVDATRSF